MFLELLHRQNNLDNKKYGLFTVTNKANLYCQRK